MRLITSGALICMCMQEDEGDLLCMFAQACFEILSSEYSRCPLQQRNLNVYATAHLSGDVANAVTLPEAHDAAFQPQAQGWPAHPLHRHSSMPGENVILVLACMAS